jgi:hypothetical protein
LIGKDDYFCAKALTMRLLFITALLGISNFLLAQQASPAELDSLKREILQLRTEVNQIQLNIETSQKKFRKGILVATIGYSVTIAGGLMLGRKYDDVGKVLLVTGGATGITGTFMMVDAFKFLAQKPPSPPR